MAFEYVSPYGRINYPIGRVHNCRFPKANVLNLEGIFNSFPNIYKIFAKENKIITNPRVCEIPLLFYILGKYKKSSGVVLDIGCCESPISVFLSSMGYKVYGVDINNYELSEICGDNFTFIRKDVAECNFKQNMFDVIVAISTIEHIGIGSVYGEKPLEDKDYKVVKLIWEWLKDDGILIMSVPMEKEFKIVSNFERHYDFYSVYTLLKDFEILEEIFIKKNDNGLWQISQKDEVSREKGVFVGFFVAKKKVKK